MRRLLCLLFCCLVSGCSLGGDEPLEAQLRLREDQIRNLEARVESSEQLASASRKEAIVLREKLQNPDSVPRSEQLAAGLAVDELQISSLLTGLTDEGDLHAVIRPVDQDGDLIKLPGKIEVQLINLSAPSGRQALGNWAWDQGESKDLWSSAVIGAGYVVDIPVDKIPAGAELMLHARFIPGDGRQFDASQALRNDGVVQADFEDAP